MTTINYIGAALANFKSVKVVPGVNALDPAAVVSIGLGPYLLTQTGWNATVLANLWNTSANPFLQQITASVSGNNLILTSNVLGLDFELVCTINGSAVQVSSIQKLSILASGGTFTVSDGTNMSGNITYSGTPATLVSNMQTAINAMTGYSVGDVVVTYDSNSQLYVLDFSGGQFAGVTIATWTADGTSLTGGNAAATITRVQDGNVGTDEIVTVAFPAYGTHTENIDTIQTLTPTGSPVSGSFTLDVPGHGTTAAIPFNAGRSVVKRILEDLVGQGNTLVTGGPLAEGSGSGSTGESGTLTDQAYFTDNSGIGSGSLVTGSPTTIGAANGAQPQTDALFRFTLPVPSSVVQAASISLTKNTNGAPSTNDCQGTIYGVIHADAALPADGAAAVFDRQSNSTSASTSFSIPFATPTSTVLSFDVTSIVQEIVTGGLGNGSHLILYFVAATGSGKQTFTNITLDVSFATPTYTYRPVTVEFVGDLAGTNITVMTASGIVTPAVTQVGGSQTVNNITGGTWSLVIPGHFTVPNIPYNVSAASLQTLINTANGGVACCTVTGGPAPGSTLTIHFNGALATTAMSPYITVSLTGNFSQTVSISEVRAAQATPAAANVYEMVVCPGEGTLAVSTQTADVSRFYAVLTILEANTINPAYDPTANRQIFIPLLNCNANRIEGAINEAFGKDVVRVTRTGHSLEHDSVATHQTVSAVGAEAGFIHFWYYVDTYRLVFVNDYAATNSFTSVTISFASVSDVNPAPAGPSVWMDTKTVPEVQNNASGDAQDMYAEFVRTYNGFTTKDALGEPVHRLTIAPYASYTDNRLSFKAKLMSQYPFVDGLTTPSTPTKNDWNRTGIAKQIIDHSVTFNWLRRNYTTGDEVPAGGTVLGSSVGVAWDSPPEVIQSALEGIFGAGNVLVTGSLVNSWQSELTIDAPNAELAYQELRITLIGQLAYLPYNEIGMDLNMVLTNTLTQDNDTVRCVVPYLEPYSKPLPTQINNRQRIVVNTPNNDAFTLGVGTKLVTLTKTSTVQSVQTALNALLGTNNIAGAAKYQQAVTMYGSDFTKPVEIEFTGCGYQFTQQSLVFGFTAAASVGLLTVTQTGVNPTQETQALAITGSPHAGTYTVHGSGNIAYNADAATIQTAVGASPPTVAGTYPNFTLTWPSASGPQSLWTTTSALNNSAVAITQTQQGGSVNGTSASVSVSDLTQGQGPLYFDNPANYSPAQVPGSQDTLIFDDATSAVQYGLNQSSIFTVASLGADARLRHSRLRQVFQNGQKVWLKNQGTAPTGLTLGNYYYVVNQASDYTFQLSATPGGSPIAITTIGVGPLELAVHNLTVQIYSRYAGNQIGLPNINNGVGLPEYLPRYLTLSGPTMTIGIGDGNALSMLRVDTMTEAAAIQILNSGQSLINNIPALLFLFNNAASTLNIVDGDVGVAVYSDETSTLGAITGTGGSLLLHAVNAASISANGLTVTEQNALVSGLSSL